MYSFFLADIPTGVVIVSSIGIVFGCAIPVTAIIMSLKHAQRRQELWHETARVALEKGLPLPAIPENDAEARREPPNDFRTGLIMIAIGAGLYLFFLSLFGGWLCYVGAIPGFIGVALLLYAALNAFFARKNKSPL